MKKSDRPSELFIGAIQRGYDQAVREQKPVTCSKIWDYVVIECLRLPDGFTVMFKWDTSEARRINRIGTIQECIQRGYVPGLSLWATGNKLIVEQY